MIDDAKLKIIVDGMPAVIMAVAALVGAFGGVIVGVVGVYRQGRIIRSGERVESAVNGQMVSKLAEAAAFGHAAGVESERSRSSSLDSGTKVAESA